MAARPSPASTPSPRPGQPGLGQPGRSVCGRGEAGVAPTAGAALRGDEPSAREVEVAEQALLRVDDLGAHRHLQLQVLAAAAVLAAARAGASILGAPEP